MGQDPGGARRVAKMFGNRPYCTVGDVESEGDSTMFSVTFGRVRTLSFGDKIQSSPIKAGGSSWIVVYFPKVCSTAVPQRGARQRNPENHHPQDWGGPGKYVGGAEEASLRGSESYGTVCTMGALL